jgi:hypothetical protein
MSQQKPMQEELFPLLAKPKKPRAKQCRKTAKGPPKEIGQYEPDIPLAKVSINL